MRDAKFLYLLGFILLFSCDIIEEPYMNNVNHNVDTGEVVQKVLLEEFTGHQCPNCPGGAEVASQLHGIYGDRFIVIAYHAGWFARTSNEFPIDYRTSTGEELNDQFGVLAYPSGLVNRTSVDGNILLNPADWGTVTSSILENEPKLKLTISKSFNQETREVSVNLTATSLQEVNEMKVCVFLTEDNLHSPQKTQVSEEYPDGVIENYSHNHVFRTSLNGTWGTTIFSGGSVEGESQSVAVNGVIQNQWILENLSIVCFAYDVVDGNVIQVEKIKLIE